MHEMCQYYHSAQWSCAVYDRAYTNETESEMSQGWPVYITQCLPVCCLNLIVGAISAQSIRRPLKRPWKTTTTTTEAPRISMDEDDGASDACPEPNGFFADAEQCDKYYACKLVHYRMRST